MLYVDASLCYTPKNGENFKKIIMVGVSDTKIPEGEADTLTSDYESALVVF